MVLRLLLLGALALAGCPKPPPGGAGGAAVLYRWLALSDRGAPIARAIVRGDACPALVMDGTPHAMTPRGEPTAAFPVRVCESALPATTARATIAGEALPLPTARPQRIVVVGDTGCRVKGHVPQMCNDPDAFPLAKVARAIAAYKPDLVIHVGDYLYRELPCPPGVAGCVGPHGDNFPTWEADFFAPAAPALVAAPWVFARGNHEECKRAGTGWFQLLEPRLLSKTPGGLRCDDHTPPYGVPMGDVTLLVHDSAKAHDWKPKKKQIAAHTKDLEAMKAMAHGRVMIATHKPLFAVVPKRGDPTQAVAIEQRVLRDASLKTGLPAGLELWLAGHVHHFQALTVEGYPPMLTSGHGGTLLIPPVPGNPVGLPIAGSKVASVRTLTEFGFFTMERRADGGYDGAARDVNGAVRSKCSITPKAGGSATLTCE